MQETDPDATRTPSTDMLPAYAANLGHKNCLWDEAKRDGMILVYEDVNVWADLQSGREEEVRQRFHSEEETATKGVVTQWINLSRRIRNNQPAFFFHNAEGILWWAETTGEWDDSEIREISEEYFAAGQARMVVRKTAAGWSDRTRDGKLLELRNLHPIVKTTCQTVTTMIRINDTRAAYLQALLNGDDLFQWENLPEWVAAEEKRMRHGKNINPEETPTELPDGPTIFEGERSNQIEGFVYVAGLPAYEGIYKIGHANDVAVRISELQTGAPEEFIIHHKEPFRNSGRAEAAVHDLLKEKHVRGEWFKADLKDIIARIEFLKRQEERTL